MKMTLRSLALSLSLAIFTIAISVLATTAVAENDDNQNASATASPDAPVPETRPNILWITIEDWSPDLSCYGTKGIHTPHVDQLASQGVRYNRAYSTSPVCSTSRSAMMTGFHQNYIRANQHREHDKKPLPHGIKPIPHLLKDAGYFTALMSSKVDCNFTPNGRDELFQGKDWNERKPGQPFFARVTFTETHRKWNRDAQRPIDINDVELPPYYVDTPFVRRDWANGLEQMQVVDRKVGALLKRLDDEGLTDNTLVFFIGDHGRCHIRGKQFLYEGGLRIPMIMRWPNKVSPGQVSDDLVMSLDICATVLNAAGVQPPVPLHGKDLIGDEIKSRNYVFAARDKMDETHDAMRSIRSKSHKLILNLMPERPWCQLNPYKERTYPVLAEMNALNLQGKLNPAQAAFFAPTKPEIELYDLDQDPHEITNLADDPAAAEIKQTLLKELNNWRTNVIDDQGVSDDFRAANVFPEACPVENVYDWVKLNNDNYDFKKHGWPAWYPTRTLEQWQADRAAWEPYVFREPGVKTQRPSLGYPLRSKTLVEDDFSQPELKGRRLVRGDWKFQSNVGSALHVFDKVKNKMLKHGPQASYAATFHNGSFKYEVKPTGADSIVLTFDSAPATHVFRVRTNVEGGSKTIQPSLINTFAEKEKGAKKAVSIPLVTEAIPNLKADQWNVISVHFLHGKAVVKINDEVFTVRHQRVDQSKTSTKIEIQKGEIALRGVELLGF